MKASYRNRTSLYFLTTFLLTFILSLPVSAVVTLNVKNYGAKGNGIANDTVAIQKTINAVPKDGIVYIPAGKYMVDAKVSLKLKSYMHLQMDSGATLAAIPNSAERHYVLALAGVNNVEISGGKILGERDKHKGTTGEWGYGIYVGKKSLSGDVYPNPSSNILIRDIHISKMWGDGIQVGGASHDIEIRNIVSTKNRRQGLSITQAERVKVYASEFSYTEGTAPAYGIDIEPDPGEGRIAKDILIQGCDFHNNKGGGLLVYKETSGITVKWNRFEYNTYGIYTVDSDDGLIISNEFNHNVYHGVFSWW